MIQFTPTPLTEDEKNALIALKKHPWFMAVKKIEKDQRNQLWDALIRLDIESEESRKLIQRSQYYAQWREDFLKWIEMNSLELMSEENEAWISIKNLNEI